MENLKDKASISTNIPKNLPKGSIMINNERSSELPDLIKLTGQIIDFIEYIEMPSIKQMAKENNMIYKQHLENKFEEFTLDYYSIYRMLVDNEQERSQNIEKLFKMIDRLKNIEIGQSNVEKEFIQVREELAEEYLYPKFGGKNEFQKALEKDPKYKTK